MSYIARLAVLEAKLSNYFFMQKMGRDKALAVRARISAKLDARLSVKHYAY